MINSGRAVPFLGTRNKLFKEIINMQHDIVLTGYETGYKEKIEKLGATYLKTPVNRAGFNPFKDLYLIYSYYKIIKNKKITLVHSYTIKPNIYGAIAARLAGVKEVYPTVNGLGYAFTGNDLKTKFVRLITTKLYKIAFACSKKVFFQNQDDANEMISKKVIKKDKCVVIAGSGIDLEEFYELPQPKEVSFVMITRLLKSKGVYYYLKAAEIVKELYPNVEFKLAGPLDPNPDGVKKEDLEEFIRKGVVKYLGKTDDVHSVIGKSSVFVLPSYYREGVPHAILEAMSTGRAILTTDSPGCRETVIEGVNGFLVPTKNTKKLADKMIWFINNPDEIRIMGKESRELSKNKFDVIDVNNQMLSTMNLK